MLFYYQTKQRLLFLLKHPQGAGGGFEEMTKSREEIINLLAPYIQDGKLREIPIEKKRELALTCYPICPCGVCEYVETGKDCWNFNGCLETIWEFLKDSPT